MDSGLVSLALLARLQGSPADPGQLAHDLGLSGDADVDDLLLAAKRLSLKAKVGLIDCQRVGEGKLPLPCIVELHGDGKVGFAVLARAEIGKALIHDPRQGRPQTVSMEELARRLTGRAVFVTSRAQLAAELSRFDFTWFVPAIVKYRRLVGEALRCPELSCKQRQEFDLDQQRNGRRRDSNDRVFSLLAKCFGEAAKTEVSR